MSAALTLVNTFVYTHVPALRREPRGVLIAGAGLVLFALGVWSVVGGRLYAAGSTPELLYPSAPVPVAMMDVSEYTVAQVVEGLPVGLKFEMLLKRTGEWDRLMGQGSFTIFVPADNYFDYIGLPALTRAEERALAERHVISHAVMLPQEDGYMLVEGGFAIKGYYAQNGVVYLISRVLTD